MNRNLTPRYCTHLATTEIVCASFQVFGATYLLTKGLPASYMGTLGAVSGLLICAVQPMLAGIADRAKKPIILPMLAVLSVLTMLCFGALLIPSIPLWSTVLFYYLGTFLNSCMSPLHSSVSLYYMDRGYRINYGLARGVGTGCYGAASLCLGYLIQWFGLNSMPIMVLTLLPILLVIAMTYPKQRGMELRTQHEAYKGVSVLAFFKRYRWYCMTLLGYLLLTGFHNMTEGYLIRIVERLGGNSSHVGIALFMATSSSVFVFASFNRIRKKVSDQTLLKVGALFYLLKSILLLIAPNIVFLCLVHLLQTVSFAFVSPTLLYYARDRVDDADMVKGQAFIAVACSLGVSLGTFVGGHMLDSFGVTGMMVAGIVLAVMGTVVIFVSVKHKELKSERA